MYTTAHRAFVYMLPRSMEKRLHWKMSIDLTRPLVASMGQHDALDGFLTCVELEATASDVGARSGPLLAGVITDFFELVDRRTLATDDPLGIGGLLIDARRAADLSERGALPPDDDLSASLVDAARSGLRRYLNDGHFRLSAERRLAFRELGLAIGIHAAGPDELGRLAEEIEAFWTRPENRAGRLWREHEDIDEVMLATALAPEGFIGGARSGERAVSYDTVPRARSVARAIGVG
jgi:hypothetical protein